MLIALVSLALLNAFLAGFHGSAAVVSTAISSRAVSPRTALLSAASAALLGPLLFGTAVASTIGQQLLAPEAATPLVMLCGLLAATSWILFTWLMGIPCSASQALLGGLLGAAVTAYGFGAVQGGGFVKALIGLFISPPLGLLAGLLVMRLLAFLVREATPRANGLFKYLQWFTTLGLALTISSNDAQKFMGIITLILLMFGCLTAFSVPPWVIWACAGVFALGMLSGGYRLIRTLGGRIFRLRPIHAFSAQLAAAVVILSSSYIGLPVSTTQIVSMTIFGVGSAERISKVRWHVAGDLLTAWVLTLPVTAGLAALSYWLLKGWSV